MKLLVIGDAAGAFLLSFVKHLKNKDSKIIVDVLNINEQSDSNQLAANSLRFRHIYRYYRSFGRIDKVPKLRKLCGALFQLVTDKKVLSNETYEIVILFGLWPAACSFYLKHRDHLPFTVGVIMGSDYLLMEERKDKNQLKSVVNTLDRILVGNPILYNQLIKVDEVDSLRLRQVYFGLEPLALLEKAKNISRENSKTLFGINSKTLVIVCGYNANPNQQHIDILKAIRGIENLPEDHLLIIPLSYGGDQTYKEIVKQYLSNTVFKYRVIDSFITDEEIVLLRKSTDIFIQVQKTDSFSGSMQENLYCGNIVITGSWLPYGFLEERGIRFFTIDTIDQLKSVLESILPQFAAIQAELSEINTPDKFSTGFWVNCIDSWYEVLLENTKKHEYIDV